MHLPLRRINSDIAWISRYIYLLLSGMQRVLRSYREIWENQWSYKHKDYTRCSKHNVQWYNLLYRSTSLALINLINDYTMPAFIVRDIELIAVNDVLYRGNECFKFVRIRLESIYLFVFRKRDSRLSLV